MNFPDDLKYSKEHEWIKVDGKQAKVGVTDYAQSELGDVVFVELPAVGDEFALDDTFGTVESVKAVSDIFAPVSGTVVEINPALEDSPELINEDCYGEAWMVVIEMDNLNELDTLMNAEEYEAFVAEEAN